ncbi:MAG: AAA family ATPase [Myxococcota bacterium]
MRELDDEQQQRAWRLGALLTEEVHQQGGGMLGSYLGKRLRKHDATFLTDTRLTLTKLLDLYAPELTVVGRSGVDLIWGLELDEDAPDIDAFESLLGDGDVTGEQIEWLSAEFSNYRSLRSASLHLAPLTILIGRNGAGKSNILDGLFRASLLTRRKPDAVFAGSHAPERVVGRWDPSLGFSLTARGTHGWSFEYRRRFDTPQTPAGESLFTTTTGDDSHRTSSLLFTPMGQAFGEAVYLRLEASQLLRPTSPPREEPFLRHDGLFLPSVLAHIVQTDRTRFDEIIGQLQELVPSVQDLRTPWEELEHSGERVMGNRLEVKMQGVGWIPTDQLSEGTLLVLGLLTILSRQPAPRLLLLDDVDRGLHPSAQRTLIIQLQKFASSRTKIVCTSHSPYVIDPLPIDAVRVVIGDPETGATSIHGLEDHPGWSKWSDTMTPADFWQYVGDETWPQGPHT